MNDEADGSPESEGSQSPSDPPRAPDEPASVRPRLDPARAAAARRALRHPAPQVVDTRRYQRLIGLFGLLLVIVISVSFLTTRGPGTAGVPAGKRLPLFAAPLADSTFNGPANLNPACTTARHDPRALNICLLVKRAPLVLVFFVTSSSGCEQQVDALQRVSKEAGLAPAQFAAVAVRTSHADAARAVRQHHWTIPVAYDVDGRVGAAYGVEVCPIVELARRGGIVARRLIGQHWASAAALAPEVRQLVHGAGA
ncbi:MAG TPA: TlpA disulfide reductase family protein [Solirubrobacteraceae bacterium]|nr:TlpA disulfide reductase family protein [Solirubrobacteraceae bacterium]